MRVKKSIILLVMVFLIFSLAGCGGKDTDTDVAQQLSLSQESGNIKIVTSFYPMYLMAANIAKDISGVEVVNMTEPITGCLHDYQFTPKDLKCLTDADFMVINGAGMESFLDKVIDGCPELKLIEASQGLELIKDDEHTGEPNPHLWVSVSYAIDQVKNIRNQLKELDPDHAKRYQENADLYLSKLDALRQKMHEYLDDISRRDIVAFHDAFPYFAQEFDLNIVAVIEKDSGSELSAGEFADCINTIKRTGVKTIFAEPQYPAKTAEAIARETGATVYSLDPVVTGPMDLDSYIRIMEKNMETLREALH